jgi:hypothetical protein
MRTSKALHRGLKRRVDRCFGQIAEYISSGSLDGVKATFDVSDWGADQGAAGGPRARKLNLRGA